jgi:hypothetical protein
MPIVELDDQEWQQVMNWIATRVTWAEANPLLMKIGNQLRQQQPTAPPMAGKPIRTDGKEQHHE